jgi:hypothetical protein
LEPLVGFAREQCTSFSDLSPYLDLLHIPAGMVIQAFKPTAKGEGCRSFLSRVRGNRFFLDRVYPSVFKALRIDHEKSLSNKTLKDILEPTLINFQPI